MSEKKEFWLRHENYGQLPRVWDRHKKAFYTIIWVYERVGKILDEKQFVMQSCTGCKDKNGRMIFEGDILETDEAGWIGVVVFGDGRFSIEDSKGGFSAMPNWNGCKIIGNVYQNSELIP